MNEFPFPAIRKLLLPVVLVALILGAPYLLAPIANVLLAIFSGILFAIFLDGLTRQLRRILPLPRLVVLGIVIVLLLAAVAGIGYLAGSRITEQAARLAEQVPRAVEMIRENVLHTEWAQQILPQDGQQGLIPSLMGHVTSFFGIFMGGLAFFGVAIFVGFYIAISPDEYLEAVIRLLPPAKRQRGREVMEALARTMAWWLVGRFSSMAVVGVLTAIGLLLVGEPLALILGVIAGILSFIPFLGPVLSAIPAVLIGLTRGVTMALWVVGVFLVVQIVESNLITPIIQRKAVMLPPAFLIAAQFLMGVMLGFLGVLLVTPLTVLVTVLVQMLYIQDVLGDEVKILGQHGK